MKILFSDYDGTLVEKYQSISPKNKEMLNKLHDKGHLFVICTGRNIKEFQCDKNRSEFPFDYLILNNGGHIVDKNFQTLYEKVIDKEVGIDILEHTTSYKGLWSYFCDGKETYGYKDGVTVDHSLEDQTIDKDFYQLYHGVDHFQIIAFNQDDEGVENARKCYDYIQENLKGKVEAYFNTHYVDVVPSECSKGSGVHKLLELLEHKIDEIYAIGDSYNDLSMIQSADYGYTFNHAHEDIKQVTKYHVNYVYEVIEDMLRGEKE